VGAKWSDYVYHQNENLNLKEKYKLIVKPNKVPAMVIASTDKDGKVVGVQRTYLDPYTANKHASFSNPKLSKGIIKNGAVLQVGNNKKVYIAEGIETAASVALADPKATVIVSMSISNMHNMVAKAKSFSPQEVILLKDNDGANTKIDATFNKAVTAFKQAGFKVTVKEPQMLSRIVTEKGSRAAKTDWNDIIQDKGLNGLRRDLDLPVPERYATGFLKRLDTWKKLANQIPNFAKNQENAKLLRSYIDAEYKNAKHLLKCWNLAKNDKEFNKMVELPKNIILIEQLIKSATNLAKHEQGFRVAKSVGFHKVSGAISYLRFTGVALWPPQEV